MATGAEKPRAKRQSCFQHSTNLVELMRSSVWEVFCPRVVICRAVSLLLWSAPLPRPIASRLQCLAGLAPGPYVEEMTGTGTAPAVERLLDAEEVAERLHVSAGWVRDHAVGRRLPALPCIRLGCLIRFRPADIAAFIAEQSHAKPWRKRRS